MTTVITPNRRQRDDGDPVGKLAGTLLSVTVAGMADAQRFRRGKAYVAEGAVTRLEIRSGALIGQVSGSRSSPYTATIAVRIIERPSGMQASPLREHVKHLIPHPSEFTTTCTCPDAYDPCKHVVATLLAMAHEISNDPDLLVEWRCGPAGTVPRARLGSRASGARHLHSVPTAANPTNPFESDEWKAFEGSGLAPADLSSLSSEPLAVGAVFVDSVDIGQLLRSALASIRDQHDD